MAKVRIGSQRLRIGPGGGVAIGDGFGLGMGGGSPPVTAVALDPAVTTAMASSAQDEFAFSRVQEGYTGKTSRWQRSTPDTAQADFGFDIITGKFDIAGLLAWSSGNCTLVHLFSQKVTGKLLAANTATSIPGIVGGVYQTFATTWSTVDGQLTINQGGGFCVAITGGAYLTLSNSGFTVGSGIEFHLLQAPLARKKATATNDAAALGATTTSETLFSYGTASTNYFRYIYGGGTSSGLLRRIGTSAGGTDQNLSTTNTSFWKKNGQVVLSCRNDGTEISMYGMGRRIINAAPSAGNITANASLDNGQFRVGADFAGGTAGNMLFGGVIITNTLAAKDRTYIHFALNAVAQQHRILSAADTYALLDEVIDFRDVDGNGLVTGRKGKTGIQFNKTVGTPAWDFAYDTPQQGLRGVRSTSASNTDNTYRATNNYFTDVQTGSMLALCVNENTDINQTWSLRADADTADMSLGMGRHHTSFIMQRAIAKSKDTQEWTRHLYTTEGADAGGGKISQAMAKYQFNLGGDWTPGAVTTGDIVSVLYSTTIPSGTTLDTATAATVGWFPPTPEGQYSTISPAVDLKDLAVAGELLLHIATFKKGPNYNAGDAEATRRLYMRTGTNWSYASHPGVPIGAMDGCIARDIGTGSIVDSDTSHRIQSNTYQGVVNMGTHIMWAFAKTELTMAQVEQLNVNLYKFIYQGYPA